MWKGEGGGGGGREKKLLNGGRRVADCQCETVDRRRFSKVENLVWIDLNHKIFFLILSVGLLRKDWGHEDRSRKFYYCSKRRLISLLPRPFLTPSSSLSHRLFPSPFFLCFTENFRSNFMIWILDAAFVFLFSSAGSFDAPERKRGRRSLPPTPGAKVCWLPPEVFPISRAVGQWRAWEVAELVYQAQIDFFLKEKKIDAKIFQEKISRDRSKRVIRSGLATSLQNYWIRGGNRLIPVQRHFIFRKTPPPTQKKKKSATIVLKICRYDN